MPREDFMRLAIERARAGMAQGQWPYGACLVQEGEVIACVHNVNRTTMDPTAHAEIHALREGCVKLQSLDLTGCEIYATCEPCPMCFTACPNAKVSSIVYGASLEDSPHAGRRGRIISSSQMKELLDSPIRLIGGFLRDEAMQLFKSCR
jgi:tRNA(Arg) A34 adenosine deaminase TadA